jgi:hypothetical protein
MYWWMYKYIILDDESYRISRETHLCADTLWKDVFYECIYNGRKKLYGPPAIWNSIRCLRIYCVFQYLLVNVRLKQDSIIRLWVYYMHYNEVCLVLLDHNADILIVLKYNKITITQDYAVVCIVPIMYGMAHKPFD